MISPWPHDLKYRKRMKMPEAVYLSHVASSLCPGRPRHVEINCAQVAKKPVLTFTLNDLKKGKGKLFDGILPNIL